MKGNINRKYLKRRKSWFRRNFVYLLLIFLVSVCAISGAVFLIDQYNAKEKKAEIESKSIADQQLENIQWIVGEDNNKETISYTPPGNIQFPYLIKVNRAMCCVTVYGIDSNEAYSIPVISFACSVGKQVEETIVGENYTTTDKYAWRMLEDNSYGQYAFRINGSYLFHSVPYFRMGKDSLETDQFNKLGEPASLGCIRMQVKDVMWLYTNCLAGTKVTIYDDLTSPGPLGKPETIKIPESSPNSGWDPTDPDQNNPWLKSKAAISGAKDVTVKIGQTVDLKAGIKATDTCGNDISDKIIIIGRYTFDKPGEYDIKYKVTDAIGSIAEVNAKLTVKEQ